MATLRNAAGNAVADTQGPIDQETSQRDTRDTPVSTAASFDVVGQHRAKDHPDQHTVFCNCRRGNLLEAGQVSKSTLSACTEQQPPG